jgi:hypothetical protein
MAARGIRAKSHEKLDDITLQKVWGALNSDTPITKKEACETLNISYNTTRLSKILAEHRETMDYRATRKSQLKGTKATDAEVTQTIEWYLNEHPVSDIAKAMYRSSTFVKNIINRVGIPEKRPKTEQGEKNRIGYLPDECVSETFEEGEKVWCARYDLPGIIKKETKNNQYTNYEEKYGGKCYQVYVIQLTDFESPYFGYQEFGGFNAHAIAYDLGSLKHLEKYGASI